jgi:hypothetical protein
MTQLPAPVWLFKALHDFTFALHIAAVDLLLGGLVLAIAFALMGRTEPAAMIVHRLPNLMAFAINLGIPPLLFAQVLYGHAMAGSSVLIGTYWLAVILLLFGSYSGILIAARRADRHRSWVGPAFAALLMVLTMAFIYSNNMTLMLQPQAWPSLHPANSSGFRLNSGDPTFIARWLFFIAGAFPVAGAGLALLALGRGLGEPTRRFLAQAGGVAIAAGILMQGTFADLVYVAQPQGVMAGVIGDPLYGNGAYGWVISAVLLFAAGLRSVIASSHQAARKMMAIGAASLALLNVGAMVMVRDGIRDAALRARGFDVWDRPVAANWALVSLSFALVVIALGVIGYLVTLEKTERFA